MLERVIAFGVVVALLFGLSTWLRDEEEPGGAEPLESGAPDCPDGCGQAGPATPARGVPLRFWDDERDRDDDDERKERKEKGSKGKGRRGGGDDG